MKVISYSLLSIIYYLLSAGNAADMSNKRNKKKPLQGGDGEGVNYAH